MTTNCKSVLYKYFIYKSIAHNKPHSDITIIINGFVCNFSFDLEKEFPFLTTKKLYYKAAIKELLWIFQKQSNKMRSINLNLSI